MTVVIKLLYIYMNSLYNLFCFFNNREIDGEIK